MTIEQERKGVAVVQLHDKKSFDTTRQFGRIISGCAGLEVRITGKVL